MSKIKGSEKIEQAAELIEDFCIDITCDECPLKPLCYCIPVSILSQELIELLEKYENEGGEN